MQVSSSNIRIISIALIILFTTVFLWFIRGKSSDDIIKRMPGMDERPAYIGENDSVIIGEFFELFSEQDVITSANNWPRFRGSDLDNISRDPTPIKESWPEDGPPIVWQMPLGDGHAAASVFNGKVYILDYDEKIRADALRCFSLKTGEELWRRWYNVAIKRNHGMSRSIPTVTEDYIISIGPRCHVMCLESASGELLWTIDLVRDFGATIPQWYTAQCPLIDNDVAIIAIGGESLMMGIDCKSGEILWETPNPNSWRMSHSSIMTATIHGQKTYIYMAIGGICGIAADGDRKGEILWETSEWSPAVIATSPLYIGNNEIVFTTGYGAGGGRIKISKTGSEYNAVLSEIHTPREGLSSEQQTPVLIGEYIWTINPKDAGALRNQLACYHVSDLRNPVWASGKENRYGLGPYLVVGDKMFLLNDDTGLYMFRHNTNSVTLLDSHKIIEDGIDAWGPLVFVDGYLLMRDSHNMLCLYVGE